MSIDLIDFDGIASGIRRLCMAASANIGIDCFLHAAFGCKLLEEMGVHAEYRVGFAAWRVGEGDGDVITHRPSVAMTFSPGAVPAHAWIELPGALADDALIVDFTTYQLRGKAAALDAMDGGRTLVDWAPDYLIARAATTSSFHNVAQGKAGQYYYEFNAALTATVIREKCDIDPADLKALRLLVANPSMRALGPNQAKIDFSIIENV